MSQSQDDHDDDITYKRGNVSDTVQASSRANQTTAGRQTRNNDQKDNDRGVKGDDVPQRRASFKQNALRERRRSQKKSFDSLMEAVKKSGSSQSLSRQSKGETNKSRSKSDTIATKIQSFFRGVRSRKKKVLKDKGLKEGEATKEVKEKVVVERMPFPLPRRGRREKAPISDISMDSSFQTLGSLEHSPRTNMKRMNEEYYNAINSPTSDTCFEDSFSTVFSAESTDLPVRLPRRTQSPLPSPSAAMKDRRRSTVQKLAADVYFPSITPDATIEGHQLSPNRRKLLPRPATRMLTVGSPETETSQSSGFHSRSSSQQGPLKSYKSWPSGDFQSLNNLSNPPLWSPATKTADNRAYDKTSLGIPRRSTILSLSTGFERDEPAKVPARSQSVSPPVIPDTF